MGDVHVYGTLAEIRAGFDRRYLVEEHGVDGHLVLFYGAILHLWAVERGTAVAGIDLTRYLRTGDSAHDRVVARLLDPTDPAVNALSDAFEDLLWSIDHEPMRGMATFARLFELYDSGAVEELQELTGRLKGERPRLSDHHPRLALDWAAIEADLPVPRGPALTTGEVTIVWPQGLPPQPEGYIPLAFNDEGGAELRAGLNDLEFGDNEYLETLEAA